MTEKSLLRASNTDPGGKSAVRAENLGSPKNKSWTKGS
jgi:hypothetical protein